MQIATDDLMPQVQGSYWLFRSQSAHFSTASLRGDPPTTPAKRMAGSLQSADWMSGGSEYGKEGAISGFEGQFVSDKCGEESRQRTLKPGRQRLSFRICTAETRAGLVN